MKTRFLAIFSTVTLALAVISSTARADEKTNVAAMEAIGASAAIGVFCAHMALNTLGDGWNAKLYTNDAALKLAGGYKGGIGVVSKTFTKLTEDDSVGAEDKASLNTIIEICSLISSQADALVAQINEPSEKNAADYQAKRAAAEKEIFGFMGIEDGVLPNVGDKIGK